jgi:hypothetical protein
MAEHWPPVIPIGGSFYDPEGDTSKFTFRPRVFDHPSLQVPGGDTFVWPLGTEGFRLTGNAQLGIHRYLGDDAAVVEVSHRSESRIEMSGEFPGKTGVLNMRALRDVLEAPTPEDGKVLRLPLVFTHEQYVVAENWDFNHAEDDRTETVVYTVTFVKTGFGKRVKPVKDFTPPPNPTRKGNKGQGARTFRVRDGARTLRAIAHIVYKNSARWSELYALNKQALNKFHIPFHQIPTQRLPLGFRVKY